MRIYREDEHVDLLCVASGYPPPKYVYVAEHEDTPFLILIYCINVLHLF